MRSSTLLCGACVHDPKGNLKSSVGSRWYCRHQHAFSCYFQLPTRVFAGAGCWFVVVSKSSIPPRQEPPTNNPQPFFNNDRRPGAFAPGPGLPRMLRGDEYRLLHFDSRTSGFKVLLELLGILLRSAFLDDATGFGEVLGFFQAQAGDGTDGLDDLDLLVASGLQDDVELGLLFDRASSGSGRTGSGDRGGGGDAKLFFDRLDQLHHFHEALFSNGVDDLFVRQGHVIYLRKIFWDGFQWLRFDSG